MESRWQETGDDIVKQPENGADTVLTIDATMQRISEEAIKNSVEATKASAGQCCDHGGRFWAR